MHVHGVWIEESGLSVVQGHGCVVTVVCNVSMLVTTELIFFSQIHVVLDSIDEVVILFQRDRIWTVVSNHRERPAISWVKSRFHLFFHLLPFNHHNFTISLTPSIHYNTDGGYYYELKYVRPSVGWVCRRFLPLIVYQLEHHFCVMHSFRCLSKNSGILSPQVHTWPRWCATWDQAGSPWNPSMKDDVELPGDFQLQNESARVCEWFTMRHAPISFLSRTLQNLFVGSGIFYMRTLLAYLLTRILGSRCQKIALTHDRNWSHFAMMVMDCLCLSIRSFKFIPVGFILLRTDQRNPFYKWCLSGQW